MRLLSESNYRVRFQQTSEITHLRSLIKCQLQFEQVGESIPFKRSRPMSHHLFLLSPSDTPLYSLTHHSIRTAASSALPLSSNLPTWSTSAFAGTVAALSGASAAERPAGKATPAVVGGGQDRHVVQMIANASLDVIEETVRLNAAM